MREKKGQVSNSVKDTSKLGNLKKGGAGWNKQVSQHGGGGTEAARGGEGRSCKAKGGNEDKW